MPLLMKHHVTLGKGGGGGAEGNSAGCEIIRGRTPIIFHSESGSDSSSSPHGCSSDTQTSHHQRQRATSSRRPPPYRTVPLPWPEGSWSGEGKSTAHPAAAAPVRARSVPPQPPISVTTNTDKPTRPKSLHQDFLVTSNSTQSLKTPPLAPQPTYPSPHNTRCYPLRPSVSASAFPLSVSLQFDCLSPEWSTTSDLPVPSPAPAERRHFVRPSRAIQNQQPNNPTAPIPRSSSVPRAQSPSSRGALSSGRHPRPLSHPAGPAGSQWTLGSQPANELRSHESLLSRNTASGLSCLATSRSHGHLDHRQRHQQFLEPLGSGQRWPLNCFNGFQLGATPAPAPSPSSTPSPSSRPLSHLPNDALRTNQGIRMLETKLDLYVDIMHAQERFVQVSHFQILAQLRRLVPVWFIVSIVLSR